MRWQSGWARCFCVQDAIWRIFADNENCQFFWTMQKWEACLELPGSPRAELCDASVPRGNLAVENKHSIQLAQRCFLAAFVDVKCLEPTCESAGCSHSECCDALRCADSCWQSDQRSFSDSHWWTDGPWQVLDTYYADSRDGQDASACRMQSEGFLQTMKTACFTGLCRSERLVLSCQGTPHAELCDASVPRDKLAVENKHSIQLAQRCFLAAFVVVSDGPWQVLHTWYADCRDGQGASACRMQSEGFSQTMKTASFS